MNKKTAIIVALAGIVAGLLVLAVSCGVVQKSEKTGGTPAPLSKLYITTGDDEVLVFDIVSRTFDLPITFGAGPDFSGVALSPDKNTLYIVSTGSDRSVYAYDLTYRTHRTCLIPVSTYDQYLNPHLAVSTDGSRVFVAGKKYLGDGGVIVITTADMSVECVATEASIQELMGGAATSDYAYFSDDTDKLIAKYDIQAKSIVSTVAVPESNNPKFVTLNPAKNKLYVPTYNGYVRILDLASFTFDATPINIGAYGVVAPHHVAFIGNGSKAYCANHLSGTISVIDVGSKSVTKVLTPEGAINCNYVVVDDGRNKAYVNDWSSYKLFFIDTVNDTVEAVIDLPISGDMMAGKSVSKEKLSGGMAF